MSTLVRLKLRNRNRYSPEEYSMALNLYICLGKKAYRFLTDKSSRDGSAAHLKLPCERSLLLKLQRMKATPGVCHEAIEMIKYKVNLNDSKNRSAFLLIDEMAIKKGYGYEKSLDKVFGAPDFGTDTHAGTCNSALVMMLVGVTKKWKQPIGYVLNGGPVSSSRLKNMIQEVIEHCAMNQIRLLGITSDQGSNFEAFFKQMSEKPSDPSWPYIIIKTTSQQNHEKSNKLLVLRDPPHLIKNARNFLLRTEPNDTLDHKKGDFMDVKVPDFPTPASWNHIIEVYEKDCVSSLRMLGKIRQDHVYNVGFSTKQKVSIAAQTLSNSMACALKTLGVQKELDRGVFSTASYAMHWNNIFDYLNSLTSKCKVPKRKPLTLAKHNGIQEEIVWLKKLQDLNSHSKQKFILGAIQSLRVVLELSNMLTQEGCKYLSVRSICQDPLEQHFSKLRYLKKNPTAREFYHCYSRCSIQSMLQPSRHGNCSEIMYHESVPEVYVKISVDFQPKPTFSMTKDEVATAMETPQKTDFCSDEESLITENSASYFLGYIMFWFRKPHQLVAGKDVKSCRVCSGLLQDATLKDHLFVMYKDYSTWNKKDKLNYVSADFVNHCIKLNRVFLYVLQKYKRSPNFIKSLINLTVENIPNTYFCNSDLYQRFLKQFYTTRLFHCLKAYNNKHFGTKNIVQGKRSAKEEKLKILKNK